MSELKDYILNYWRDRWIILGVVVVAVAATIVGIYTQPKKYAVSESFAINRINSQSTAEYQYDGYYALQASDLYSETVVSWFTTPSVLREFYDNAGIVPDITTVDSLTSKFKVKKYSAQNIVVKFKDPDESTANKLAQSIKTVMENKTKQLNQTAEGKAIFEIVGTSPVIAKDRPNVLLWSGVAFLLALGGAMTFSAFRQYLR